MRQCLKCSWRFEDELAACPECGGGRSFAIAGTVSVKRPQTSRVAAAPTGGGTSRITVPVGGGTSRITAVAPALTAHVQPLQPGFVPVAPPLPLDHDWWDSGIHRAGLGLVVISVAYLLGIFFLAGGSLALGRAIILLIAGALCFSHIPWGINTARLACFFGLLVDLRSAYFTTIIDGFDRFALAELGHVAVIGVCLYLLYHDGYPNLKNWYRALVATVVVYLLMLVACAMGSHRELHEDARKAEDERVQWVLKEGAAPAGVFLADPEHVLGGLDHAASQGVLHDLQKAGAAADGMQVAQVEESEAHVLVVKLPLQEDRRAAVLTLVHRLQNVPETEADPDVGAQYATIDYWKTRRRSARERDDRESEEQ